MSFFQAYKMAIKSILSNKVRSLLTMLGVIIGVGSVITAVAFAQGSTKNITSSIEGLGSNLVQVSITGRGSNRNVSFEDFQEYADKNANQIEAIAPEITSSVTVKNGNKNRQTTLVGTSPDYENIRNVHVQQGRFVLSLDADYMQKIAIIGTAVANDIFEGQNPIGKKMKINGQVFKVVGILQQKANGQDRSDDDRVVIPYTVAQRLTKNSIIRNFSIKVANTDNTDFVMNELNTFLKSLYKNENAYYVFNQAQILSTLGTVTDTLMLILGGIATISLVVGGIGIMNIMLVSVTERTREIGIRKAIGAKRRNILIQFLIEAIMVTGIGGIIGILIGVSAIKFVIGGLKIVPEVYSMTWILISFSISIIVGVVFGMFPAYKASNLKPIEALRFE